MNIHPMCRCALPGLPANPYGLLILKPEDVMPSTHAGRRGDLWTETDPNELTLLQQLGKPAEAQMGPSYTARYQVGGRREDRIAPKPPRPGQLRRWLRNERGYTNSKIRRIPLRVQRQMFLASIAGLDRQWREMGGVLLACLLDARRTRTDELFERILDHVRALRELPEPPAWESPS